MATLFEPEVKNFKLRSTLYFYKLKSNQYFLLELEFTTWTLNKLNKLFLFLNFKPKRIHAWQHYLKNKLKKEYEEKNNKYLILSWIIMSIF